MLESFSTGYWLTSLDVARHGGKRALIDADTFYDLCWETGLDNLIAFAGGRHYRLVPDGGILSGVVGLPSDKTPESVEGEPVLLLKARSRTYRLGRIGL